MYSVRVAFFSSRRRRRAFSWDLTYIYLIIHYPVSLYKIIDKPLYRLFPLWLHTFGIKYSELKRAAITVHNLWHLLKIYPLPRLLKIIFNYFLLLINLRFSYLAHMARISLAKSFDRRGTITFSFCQPIFRMISRLISRYLSRIFWNRSFVIDNQLTGR